MLRWFLLEGRVGRPTGDTNGADKAAMACSKLLAPRLVAASSEEPDRTTGTIAFANTACSLTAVRTDVRLDVRKEPRRFCHFRGGRIFP